MLAQPRAAPAPIPTPIKTQVSASAQPKSAVGPQPFAYTTTTTHTVVTTTTTTTQTTTTPASFHELEGTSRREDGGVALTHARSAVTVGVANGKLAENDREEEEEGIEEHHLPLPPPITRRNTTGSIQNIASKKKHHAPGKSLTPSAFPPPLQAGFGEGSLDLASDIYKHSEKIRRERNLKRAKHLQQQQLGAEKRVEVGIAAAAAASDTENEPSPLHPHTAPVSPYISGAPASVIAAITEAPLPPLPDENPLVGNLISEGHVNYVLMYNMLTGIRIAVSRCGGKIMRPIAEEDFRAEHKYSFDIIGNELTPSAKYDFKFKDYSPFVFRHIRESIFHLDPADYLLSLTSKYILSELGSPGKSGSFFYFSRDYRFIIKTIRRSEHLFLRSVLERYWVYVRDNPQTLISRFYGLHRVKLPRGRKIHFVIMNNLFPPHKDVHETYDLKGSTVGREYPEEKAKENPGAVLKDINWITRGRRLDLGPEKRALLTEQLRRDKEFLKSLGVMDYSLLVGIHRMERGNRDRVRRSTLKVFAPEIPSALTPHTHHHHPHQESPILMAARRAAVRSSVSEPKTMRFARGAVKLPEPGSVSTGASGTGRTRSVKIDEHGGLVLGQQGHSRSLSLGPNRDQGLEVVDELEGQVQESSPSSSFFRLRQASGPGAGPASASGSTSLHTPSPTQYAPLPQALQHSAPYTPTLHPLKTPSVAPERDSEFPFLFYSDEGGLRSTNECNEPMERIYYLGVIDILTPYGLTKKAESLWKGLKVGRGGKNKISPVPPPEYADRFFAFMKAIMTGGEGGERFRVGGGEKEADSGGGEKGGKEMGNEKREGREESGGLCGCVGICRCGSSGN